MRRHVIAQARKVAIPQREQGPGSGRGSAALSGSQFRSFWSYGIGRVSGADRLERHERDSFGPIPGFGGKESLLDSPRLLTGEGSLIRKSR